MFSLSFWQILIGICAVALTGYLFDIRELFRDVHEFWTAARGWWQHLVTLAFIMAAVFYHVYPRVIAFVMFSGMAGLSGLITGVLMLMFLAWFMWFNRRRNLRPRADEERLASPKSDV
jgi:hypothetical protein